MPYTPCCCGIPCCQGRTPKDNLIANVLAWADVIYPDCVDPGEYPITRDRERVYKDFTHVWAGTADSTGAAGCDDLEFILYCAGTTADGWTLDILMDGIEIYSDNVQPDRTCNPLFLPFRESGTAIDVEEAA